MKRFMVLTGCLLALVGIGLNTGCDWTGGGGGNDFNTSKGVTVNWSGVYDGVQGGGLAVGSSAGAITRLVISQGGNGVEVVDNKGNRYTGSVGSPAVMGDIDVNTGAFPAGAQVVQAQVTWTGKDEVAQMEVEFVGIFHVVAVQDIRGTTDTRTITDNTTDAQTTTFTDVNTEDGTTTTTTIVTIGTPGDPFFSETTTEVVTNTDTGVEISRTITKTGGDNRTTTTQNNFVITEANSQNRLEGTWIEQGGGVFKVDAVSPGAPGSVTVGTGTPDEDTGATGGPGGNVGVQN